MRAVFLALIFVTAQAFSAPVAKDDFTVPGRVVPVVAFWAAVQGVPFGVAFRLGFFESSWRPTVVSPAGAVGLFQLMPSNHRFFRDAFNGGQEFSELDPIASARIGLGYLASLFRIYGSWPLAVMAYNAGPGVRVWPRESQDLARRVAS